MENKQKHGYVVQFKKWNDPLRNYWKNSKNKEAQEEFGDDDTAGHFQELNGYQGPIMMTDMGAIPLQEATLPSTIFNFYLAHTNFQLQSEHKHILDTTLGVEAVNFYTPYRFRIAIGQLFDEKHVMNTLSKLLTDATYKMYNKKPTKNLSPIDPFSSLSKQYPFYAMVGKQVFHGKSSDEVDQQVNLYIKENPDKALANIRYSYRN